MLKLNTSSVPPRYVCAVSSHCSAFAGTFLRGSISFSSNSSLYNPSTMYFARSFFLALASTPFMALAQSGANPFNVPTSGLSTSAGQSLALSWNPTTQGTVSLVLRSGNSGDLSSGTTIACTLMRNPNGNTCSYP